MTDDEGKPLPLTSHTLAPVPVAIADAGLANVTATYINLLGYATPEHMVPSLI